jgi:hypothetical protein
MGEHDGPILGNVFVQQDTGLGVAQQALQRGLAVEEWTIAHILAVMLDEVEGIEDRGIGGLRRLNSSNRDKPSSPSTTTSPSIVKLLALVNSAAAALGSSHSRGGCRAALWGRPGGRLCGSRHI